MISVENHVKNNRLQRWNIFRSSHKQKKLIMRELGQIATPTFGSDAETSANTGWRT